jgi:hypothetical protein
MGHDEPRKRQIKKQEEADNNPQGSCPPKVFPLLFFHELSEHAPDIAHVASFLAILN